MIVNKDKKILDATCGSRTIWFNKEHQLKIKIYILKRRYKICMK